MDSQREREKGEREKGRKGKGEREKGEGRREKGEGRREKGEGRREKGEGRRGPFEDGGGKHRGDRTRLRAAFVDVLGPPCGRETGFGGGERSMASSGAPETGTTVVAVRYADAKSGRSGVVLGADSRVSTGTYVSNRASNKIAELAESTYLLRSGSAADTQAVGDAVKDAAERLAMELNEAPSVHALAQITARVAYANKDRLLAAMIVAGWDRHRGGQVYGVPIGGTVVDLPWSVDGSGSTYIYGHCDAAYRDGMDKEEAVAFVQEALALAMSRDGSSGGMVRVVIVDPTGSEKRMVRGDQVPVYHEEIGSEGVVVA